MESRPLASNDPELHGRIKTARMTIAMAKGQSVKMVQLEVDEQLGDFGGYSGSAVLDSLGRAVLALLVEQKPLRTSVALGERRQASNVLYAVPIGDVISTNGLLVRTSRPLRFDAGLASPGMVGRVGLLDDAVGRVVGAGPREAGTGLVILRGPGGAGKTVLARQVADDVRVWAEFTDGIVMLRAGQGATADGVARQLQETLGYRDRHLADVLGGQRLLLIVDDVWDHEVLATLRAALPPTVTVLATSRGVFAPGAVALRVGAVSRGEAIEILARGTPRSDELDRALADLAQTLFDWALLLTLAAGQIHSDELDLMFDDDPYPEGAEPSVLIERADTLRADFAADPTMLDELERDPGSVAPRSVEVLVRRSLDWLGPEHQARFKLLAIYPSGAAITQPMLEDLWGASPNVTLRDIKFLVRAGLAQPIQADRLTIELHDLITAWLRHVCGPPDDPGHQPVHQRLAGLCILPDGSPGRLTWDRAEWLAHHLVSVAAWDRLRTLPTLKWRTAFLAASGSDAGFLAALDHYGLFARAQAPNAVYHAVRPWLFAAHIRTLIGQLPIPLLAAVTAIGDPIAGITQACQHPSAGEAVRAVLAAVSHRLDTRLLERAAAVAGTIPDDRERSRALAAIAGRLAGTASGDPVLIERAAAVAGTIPDDRERGETLAAIAGRLAGVASGDPVLIERALALVGTIPGDQESSRALANVAEALAGAASEEPALVEQALAVAGTIPEDWRRNIALASIAESLAGAASEDPALLERALAVTETIPSDWERGEALAGIAEALVGADPEDAALLERALAVAETIPEDGRRGTALAGIAGRLADADPLDPALIERALTVAGTIPGDRDRSEALAGIAGRLAVIDPDRAAALIDQAAALAGTVHGGWALAGVAVRLAGAASGDLALIDRALAVVPLSPTTGSAARRWPMSPCGWPMPIP